MSKPLTIKPSINCNFNVDTSASGQTQSGQTGVLAPVPANSFNYIEGNLGNKIVVRNAALSLNGSGTTRLDVGFANCTDFPLQIEARTQFMNDNGVPLENASGWKRVFLQPRSLSQYFESSTSDQPVASYLVDVREGY
jgi:hypothetical protein